MTTTTAPTIDSAPEEIDAWLRSQVPAIPLCRVQDDLTTDTGFDLTPTYLSDAARLTEILQDKTIYDHTLRIPYPYKLANAEWYLGHTMKTILATVVEGKPLTILALRERATGRMVGKVSIEMDEDATHKGELGYYLDKEYRIAFRKPWNLHRIEAGVFTFNESSKRVLTKAGFQFEGVLRSFHLKPGVEEPYDAAMFSLVRRDLVPS
ncbi:hypothetical protein HDU96_007539 [Phlyctochytrium bullatum]|nr:hypothetical protein HDU96_007539 [Phlyctochytrium bullatum]